jgi:sulfatase modifying factor 1
MYAQCVASGQCKPPTCATGDDDFPVICVTWNNAKANCEWGGRQLPTEAQWEKAERGTDGRLYPWGDAPASCDYAVIDDGSGYCRQGNKIWAVGSKSKGVSPYGALDMSVNVWEWVADWYDEDYYEKSPYDNPTVPEKGQYRMLRSRGVYDYYWCDMRTAVRVPNRVSWHDLNFGFRYAATIES